MIKVFRVEGLEFSIDKGTGDLTVKTEHDTYVIHFEEGVELLMSLREDQTNFSHIKEIENANFWDRMFIRLSTK